jgi:DNA-binding transcriptional MerR regulator
MTARSKPVSHERRPTPETPVTEDSGLSIGELAARAGVTAEAVRYYEREGVVPRATRGGPGRYRKYDGADVQRLRFIRRARDLGFSLDEVRGLLALAGGSPSRPCTEVDRIARTHLAQVDEKLAQLGALRTELDRLIGECDGVVPVADCRILSALSGT